MSSLWVFPGQGAQRPGMLRQLPDEPVVRECLAQASAALGEDVLRLDSAEALALSSRAVQLCLLIAGVACARLLQARECPVDYLAGLSIGAYPAAVIAGGLGFDDAVRLVALRGQLMQDAYPEGYGMTALVGLPQAAVEALIDAVHSAATPVYLANLNADNQFVIAGSLAAMAGVAQRAKATGAAARRLAVSVPSHCPLLEEPARRLATVMAEVAFKAPTLRYLSGTTARPILGAEALRDDLSFNMCRVIDWRDTLQTAFERGARLHIELPPGGVLTGLARGVFEPGMAVAFQGARLDSLVALSRREAGQSR